MSDPETPATTSAAAQAPEIRDIINPNIHSTSNTMSADSRSRLLGIIDRLEDETDRLEDAVEAND